MKYLTLLVLFIGQVTPLPQVGLNEAYLKAVENCSAKGKMPRSTAEDQNYECYDLLEQGPCQENERFLLRKDTEILMADCFKLPCGESKTLVQMIETGECEMIGDDNGYVCPYGKKVTVNSYGEGKCDCSEGFLPHKGRCYQKGSQGPCEYWETFEIMDDETTGCVYSEEAFSYDEQSEDAPVYDYGTEDESTPA